MAPRANGFTLHDLLLTEAVKDLETGTPLQDGAAMAEAAAATIDREARIVHRARRLAAATALDEDVARLRRRLAALGLAVVLAGVAVAALLALSMLGEGRRINALAAMALLIVPNAIGIVLWVLLAAGSGRGGAGLLGTVAAWLARQRWAQGRARRVRPAASQKLFIDVVSRHVLHNQTSLKLCWSTAGIRVSQAGRLDTPPLSEEDGNGLPQWNQCRPYDHIYISRKPRPVPAVGKNGELRSILSLPCSKPGHMAAYRIETIKEIESQRHSHRRQKGLPWNFAMGRFLLSNFCMWRKVSNMLSKEVRKNG